MEARAIWDQVPTPTSTLPVMSVCTPFALPSNAVIDYGNASRVTLTSDALFIPTCTTSTDVDVTVATDVFPPIGGHGGRDPFHASTLPVIYALAATTVTAYMLVILLFITPRTFVSGGTVVLGRRGFASGASGTEAGIGIGGRPWLQKVAALSVAISLSIATANAFNIAESQYNAGYMDAKDLQEKVYGGQELKIIMVISDTFLWLAQAQTLIRLFPRHREKVIIKWTALALISLCLLFSILNDFVYAGSTRPAAFVDAIPALSYLFQLALGLLYCAWVMYYALTKKQYAFYHHKMRNMCLLALISIISVLVPVVFFVVDISMPDVAGWGDYVRWVGAAAASVVVWEWVERIEALERNEKKDGVLGREIFDGDEMLEVTPSTVVSTDKDERGDKDGDGGRSTGAGGRWPAMSGAASRYRSLGQGDRIGRRDTDNPRPPHNEPPSVPLPMPQWPPRPPPAATPVSRTDTASAESTVYAVRYHPIGEAGEVIPEHVSSRAPSRASFDIEAQKNNDSDSSHIGEKSVSIDPKSEIPPSAEPKPAARIWQAIDSINPFSRKRQRPPPEVSAHTVRRVPSRGREERLDASSTRWDLLGKLEDFATEKAEKMFAKTKASDDTASLPVTRIPAPPQRRTIQEIAADIARGGDGLGPGLTNPEPPASPYRPPAPPDEAPSRIRPPHPHPTT